MMTVFFRNDDVRDKLDQILVDFTTLCIKNKMPIAHAVEPANVTQEVVDWLLETKKSHPHLIEIMQHGVRRVIRQTLTPDEIKSYRNYV